MSERIPRADSRFAGRVQLLATIAVVAASLSVIWMAAQRMPIGSGRGSQPYEVGERIGIENVDFSLSSRTLVMAFRQDCGFCQASVPFYRSLTAKLETLSRNDLRVVVVSTDESDELSQFLQSKGVHVDQIARYLPGALKIPGTPLLFLVDRAGHVKRSWRGKLNIDQELEVLGELGVSN